MKSFIITNLKTGKAYTVLGNPKTTIRNVWDSQKCWFTEGTRVRIMDERGKATTFTKKKRASQPY